MTKTKPEASRLGRLGEQRKKLTMLGLAGLGLIGLGIYLFLSPSMPDLSVPGDPDVAVLKSSWKTGEVITVIRHLERCDRADAPCLNDDPGGITARSVPMGYALGKQYEQLGLDNADIFHSPLARTTQTANIVFGSASVSQEWLYECRKEGTLLRDALAHKRPDRNLILVTHSSCKDDFEDALGYSSETPNYAASWFLVKPAQEPDAKVLGFVDAEDWDQVF